MGISDWIEGQVDNIRLFFIKKVVGSTMRRLLDTAGTYLIAFQMFLAEKGVQGEEVDDLFEALTKALGSSEEALLGIAMIAISYVWSIFDKKKTTEILRAHRIPKL